MFLKVLMLIKQAILKSVLFVLKLFVLHLVLDKGFKFQPALCNGCHNLLMMYMDLNSIAILNVHGHDYQCIINGISKSEHTNLYKKMRI